MTWIKDRIDSEYKKHKTLDWSRIAEAKIISSLLKRIEEHAPYGWMDAEELDEFKLELTGFTKNE